MANYASAPNQATLNSNVMPGTGGMKGSNVMPTIPGYQPPTGFGGYQPGLGSNVMPTGSVGGYQSPPGIVGYHGPTNDGTGHEMMVLMHGPAGSSEGFTRFLRDLMARSKAREQMQYHPNIAGMIAGMGRGGGS